MIQIDGWRVVDTALPFVVVDGQIRLASLQTDHWNVENISLPKQINSAPFLTVLSPEVLFASTASADFTAQFLYTSRNGGHCWQQIATLSDSSPRSRQGLIPIRVQNAGDSAGCPP
ncbi:MAG TPA: hypothetical protein VGF67_08405 [Ktedonobacteraceae bacterium]|jgi:hypothetical protein